MRLPPDNFSFDWCVLSWCFRSAYQTGIECGLSFLLRGDVFFFVPKAFAWRMVFGNIEEGCMCDDFIDFVRILDDNCKKCDFNLGDSYCT